jgi:hypothetical protein
MRPAMAVQVYRSPQETPPGKRYNRVVVNFFHRRIHDVHADARDRAAPVSEGSAIHVWHSPRPPEPTR